MNASITARQATPGTRIRIDAGAYVSTVYVRRWVAAPGNLAMLVASTTPRSRTFNAGQYEADHVFQTA